MITQSAWASFEKIRRGFESATVAKPEDAGFFNMSDIGLTLVELLNFAGVDIETHDMESDFSEPEDEWKTDIPKADDANYGVTGLDLPDEFVADHSKNSRIFSIT